MADYAPSPLHTRAQRDRLARKRVDEIVAEEDDDANFSTPGHKKVGSPPNSEFRTSSPTSASFGAKSTSPQYSMINHKLTPTSANQSGRGDPSSSNKKKQETSKRKSTRSPPVYNEEEDQADETSDSDETSQHTLSFGIEDKGTFEVSISAIVSLFVGLPIVVGIMLPLALQLFPANVPGHVGMQPAGFVRFRSGLQSIRSHFPSQSNTSWAMLSSQMRRLMEGRASQPACVLMLYDEPAKSAVDCLARAVLGSAHEAFEGSDKPALIESADVTAGQGISAKTWLFEKVRSDLAEKRAMALLDLDRLDASTAMALHGVCDEGFVNVDQQMPLLLMTMKAAAGNEDDFSRAAGVIKELWEGDLGVDKVSPLISRIAASVFAVKAEAGSEEFCSRF